MTQLPTRAVIENAIAAAQKLPADQRPNSITAFARFADINYATLYAPKYCANLPLIRAALTGRKKRKESLTVAQILDEATRAMQFLQKCREQSTPPPSYKEMAIALNIGYSLLTVGRRFIAVRREHNRLIEKFGKALTPNQLKFRAALDKLEREGATLRSINALHKIAGVPNATLHRPLYRPELDRAVALLAPCQRVTPPERPRVDTEELRQRRMQVYRRARRKYLEKQQQINSRSYLAQSS